MIHGLLLYYFPSKENDNNNDKLDGTYAQWGSDQFRVGFRVGVNYG